MKKILTTCTALLFITLTVVGQSAFDQSTSLKVATDFLASLTPAQKTVANLSFTDSSRVKWSNLPLE
ncbi:MAG TPA: hypothetical protein PLE32_24295, partial [Haliscomenobacter sp.]|nr:hypothetical protein [Haliscomenobacter sp.]